jgi:hypothetical protein
MHTIALISDTTRCNAGCFFERFGLIFLTEVARIPPRISFLMHRIQKC